MDINEAIDKWMAGELSIKEVMVATGFRSVAAIHREVLDDKREREAESYIWSYADDATEEQQFLETMAYHYWSDWLREEPGYLEACVRMLKYERTRKLGIRRNKPAADTVH
ncbi:hypothetical protein [Rhizobium leguminosarum]|uniref:Uncharacterized protein n=1 Tax=Rhizobium leguminosarum TaxID=384 RepID=A0A7K3VRQ6_RHILE|nr:hypothetical protein [Rhizobium leguminosarum]NEK19869.1 hypothetical protein [Rhizobium leguminosarum]